MPVNLGLDYSIEYYDRDDITEIEILEEGFTPNDDYSWKGTLPPIWNQVVLDKLLKTNWTNKSKPELNSLETLEIEVTDQNNQTIMLRPDQVNMV